MTLQTETTTVTFGPRENNACEGDHAATGLLSQQIWCWGQDIKRPEGNWLIEVGFDREPPPENQKDCASFYTLSLSESKRVVLQGFGVFYGDDIKGGIFLQRYGFKPLFTNQSRLTVGPWACEDLPTMGEPTAEQRIQCRLMLVELIEWIIQYEVCLLQRLGIGYRETSLKKWNNGKRWYLPAQRMTCLWRSLSLAIAADQVDL